MLSNSLRPAQYPQPKPRRKRRFATKISVPPFITKILVPIHNEPADIEDATPLTAPCFDDVLKMETLNLAYSRTNEYCPESPNPDVFECEYNEPLSDDMNRPRLCRQTANKPQITKFAADFDIIRKFKKRSFLNHGDHVFRGYFRQKECLLDGKPMDSYYIDIVGVYFMDLEAGIFQIAFKIQTKMLKSNLNWVTKKDIEALTVKLMSRRAVEGSNASTKDPEFYFNELVRGRFVEPVDTAEGPSKTRFRFSRVKDLEFTYFGRKKEIQQKAI